MLKHIEIINHSREKSEGDFMGGRVGKEIVVRPIQR